MSGYSEAINCPRCGSEESLEHSVDDGDIYGFCAECGYTYKSEMQYGVADLDDVNAERKEFDLEPLTELKSPVDGWKALGGNNCEGETNGEQNQIPTGEDA